MSDLMRMVVAILGALQEMERVEVIEAIEQPDEEAAWFVKVTKEA